MMEFSCLLDQNAINSAPAVGRWSGLSFCSPARLPILIAQIMDVFDRKADVDYLEKSVDFEAKED